MPKEYVLRWQVLLLLMPKINFNSNFSYYLYCNFHLFKTTKNTTYVFMSDIDMIKGIAKSFEILKNLITLQPRHIRLYIFHCYIFTYLNVKF